MTLDYFNAFDATWAQDGQVYNFDLSQYKIGWAVIGDQKPSVEQFNQVLQIVDGKANYQHRQLKAAADDRGVPMSAGNDNTLRDLLNGLRTEMLDMMFPVGHVEIMATSQTPESRGLPGTWSKITDGFLYAHGAPGAGALLSTGGSTSITLTEEQMPAHTHAVTGTAASAGNHTHSGSTASAGSHTHSASTNSTGAHTHTRGSMNITGAFRVASNGDNSSGAFTDASNGPRLGGGVESGGRRYTFNASRSWSGSTSSAGNHSHTVSVSSTGAHTHSVSVSSAGAHTHSVTGTTDSKGSGASINIMPPRLTVYMWRRVS